MAYIKIADRNLQNKEVTIISKLGKVTKLIREDRVDRYISDFILFNNLNETPYIIKQ